MRQHRKLDSEEDNLGDSSFLSENLSLDMLDLSLGESNSDSEDEIAEIMDRKHWRLESGSCPTLNECLVSRNAVIDYCKAMGTYESHSKKKHPPETWFTSNPKIVLIPRMYHPFQAYPIFDGTRYVNAVFPGIVGEKPLVAVLERLERQSRIWVHPNIEFRAIKAGSALARVGQCYHEGDLVQVPMHVFDSTTENEVTMSSIPNNFKSLYSGLTQSTLHIGLMGSLHDNTLVDIRPYEENADGTVNQEEFDPSRRSVRKDLFGFLDFCYTAHNQEAGKLRSFVHGCKIRHPTKLGYTQLKMLLDEERTIAFDSGSDDEEYEGLSSNGSDDSDTTDDNEKSSAFSDGYLPRLVTNTKQQKRISDRLLAEKVEEDSEWILHFHGRTQKLSFRKVVRMVDIWLNFRHHTRPSLHIFPIQRVLSLSLAPGCVVREIFSVYSDDTAISQLGWVDSLVFNNDIMMKVYGYERPSMHQIEQYCKSFMNTVPYWSFNQSPRPLYASSISPQALSLPGIETTSLCVPRHVSMPILRTPFVQKLCAEMDISAENRMSFPGHHLLVAFINCKDNYEDAVVVSSALNRMKVFSHTGYVSHPVPPKAGDIKIGQKVKNEHWWRPVGEGKVLRKGVSSNKTSYIVASLESDVLMVGDKIATQHGQKFTISKIVAEEEMITCYDTKTGRSFRPHIVVSSSSVHNRGTIGQVYEAWKTFNVVNRYEFDPLKLKDFVDISYDELREKPKNSYTCNFTGFSSDKLIKRVNTEDNIISCVADYGICLFWLMGHLTRDKQLYLSSVPSGIRTPKGRLKGGSVKLGEMEIISMYMKGMINSLNELLDSYDQVEVTVCVSCRRLTILCDCEKISSYTLVSTRYALVVLDVTRTVYLLHKSLARECASPNDKLRLGDTCRSFVYL
jgi:hypothetical protein